MQVGTRIRRTPRLADGTIIEINPNSGAVRIQWDGADRRETYWYTSYDFEAIGSRPALLTVITPQNSDTL